MVVGDPPDESAPDFDWGWTEDDSDWIPPTIDMTRPSAARMYDYALGGKDNFAVDREAMEKIAEVVPEFRGIARANRGFLVRAVRAMTGAGIRQFIDLGTGIPSTPSVHEVAGEAFPDATVVYVDNDPMVIAHNRALQASRPGVVAVLHDLRQPATVLDDPDVRRLMDFGEPVGLLFVAVLHFVRRDVAPEIVAHYMKMVPPGSRLAISVACAEGVSPATMARVESIFATSGSSVLFRSRAEIEQLFEGLDLESPGVTDVTQWRNDGHPFGIRVLAGVARKP